MENLSIFGDIGKVVGYPAMLLIFWLYNKVKEIEKKRAEDKTAFDLALQQLEMTRVEDKEDFDKSLQEGNCRFDRLEKEQKETNKALYTIIGKLDSLFLQRKNQDEK